MNRGALAALALVAALVVTGAAIADSTAPAQLSPSEQPPLLLPSDEAQAALDDGDVSDGAPAPIEVLPAAVSTAMTSPDEINFGTDPTAVVANGTAPKTDGGTGFLTAKKPKCWAVNSGYTWGHWPYNQHINSLAYWCAPPGGGITTISLDPTASSALCSSSANGSIVGGGIGRTSFVEQANGSWGCPTAVPWITLHTHHWLQTAHNSNGGSSQVGHG